MEVRTPQDADQGLKEAALELHRRHAGKIALQPKVPVRNLEDLALAYSPGVAEPCRRIHADAESVFTYTARANTVAVVSNGTAVLGLGNIGPAAALPVMEGKALLFKAFAGIDAWPICLDARTVDEMAAAVKMLAPTFGGFNLEDIAAPACFELEETLRRQLDLPVFHDDQHGTAIVVLAGLINVARATGRPLASLRVVVNGAGASGIACSKLLLDMGVRDLILCDTSGAIYAGRQENMNRFKKEIAQLSNPQRLQGGLAEVLKGADVFLGLSQANVLSTEMVRSMAPNPVIFALANPDPEIRPDLAREAGATVIATGRSDYPNQVNNVLAFPGVFRGALDTRSTCVNEAMKRAAAEAIAGLVTEAELTAGIVIPHSFDPRVAPSVAAAVARAAMETGVARLQISPEAVAERCRKLTEQAD